MKKRMFAIMLSLVLALSCVPAPAYATEEAVQTTEATVAEETTALTEETNAPTEPSNEEPGVPVCSCGNEGVAVESHSDGCALKKYYQNCTTASAAALFAVWNTYPEDAREYMRKYLSWTDQSKLTELDALIAAGETPKSEVTLPSGETVAVQGMPAASMLTVTPTEDPSVLAAVQQSYPEAEQLFLSDITVVDAAGGHWQPESGEPVQVELVLPDMELKRDSMLYIVHVTDSGELEYLDYTFGEDGKSVIFYTNSFSVFGAFTIQLGRLNVYYAVESNRGVLLSTILEQMDIALEASVFVTVTCSTPSLLAAERQADGDWLLTFPSALKGVATVTLTTATGATCNLQISSRTPIGSGNTYWYVRGNKIEGEHDALHVQNYAAPTLNIDEPGPGDIIYVTPGQQVNIPNIRWTWYNDSGNAMSLNTWNYNRDWSWYLTTTGNFPRTLNFRVDSSIAGFNPNDPDQEPYDINVKVVDGAGYGSTITFRVLNYSDYRFRTGRNKDTYYVIPGTRLSFVNGQEWYWDADHTQAASSAASAYCTYSTEGHLNHFVINKDVPSGTEFYLYADGNTGMDVPSSSDAVIKVVVYSKEDYLQRTITGDWNNYSICLVVQGDSRYVPNEPCVNVVSTWFGINTINADGSAASFGPSAYRITDAATGEKINADMLLKESLIDAAIVSMDGTNTIGLPDKNMGEDNRRYMNYTDDQWHELLVDFVAYAASRGTPLIAADGVTLNSTNVNALGPDGDYLYRLYPHVIKLHTHDGIEWHIDCSILRTDYVPLYYDFNLSEDLISTSSMNLPATEFKPLVDGKANFVSGAINKVSDASDMDLGDTVVIFNQYTGQSAEYIFVGWNTSADGTGDLYRPGDQLTISQPTTLYAQWAQTSGELRIEKQVERESQWDTLPDDSFTMEVTLPGTPGFAYFYDFYNGSDKTGEGVIRSGETVVLKKDQSVVIRYLPVGSYAVEETGLDTDNYTASWTGDTGIIVHGSRVTAVCVNTYKARRGDLTITKSGCVESLGTDQTFIFRVRGTDGTATAGVDLTVTIRGNGSVTIKDLPTGEYTVTENGDWSWRYEPQTPKTVTVTASETAAALDFINTLATDKDRWLSGNGMAENRFGEAGADGDHESGETPMPEATSPTFDWDW